MCKLGIPLCYKIEFDFNDIKHIEMDFLGVSFCSNIFNFENLKFQSISVQVDHRMKLKFAFLQHHLRNEKKIWLFDFLLSVFFIWKLNWIFHFKSIFPVSLKLIFNLETFQIILIQNVTKYVYKFPGYILEVLTKTIISF